MRAMSSAARSPRPTAVIARDPTTAPAGAKLACYQAWPVPQCGQVTDVVTSASKT